jgi:hypothetical protein
MLRKQKNPTPSFRLPPPFQPMSGERAPLQTHGVFPYCVLMQVAVDEDDKEEYVLCRGFDVRIGKFIDYEEGNSNKPGIPVAKPYGFRMKGLYQKAQMFAAALPTQSSSPDPFGAKINPSPIDAKIRIGQNPGKAKDSPGHPENLEEEVEELYTDDGKAINWMFIEPPGLLWCMLMEAHPGRETKFNVIIGKWCPRDDMYRFDCNSTQYKAIDLNYGMPEPSAGAMGYFKVMPSDTTTTGGILVVVSLDCESPGACGTESNELTDGECPEAL